PFACFATITNTMNSKAVKIRSTSIDTGNKSLTYGLNILIADTAIIESCVNSIYMLNVYSGDFLLLIRLKAKMTVNTFAVIILKNWMIAHFLVRLLIVPMVSKSFFINLVTYN